MNDTEAIAEAWVAWDRLTEEQREHLLRHHYGEVSHDKPPPGWRDWWRGPIGLRADASFGWLQGCVLHAVYRGHVANQDTIALDTDRGVFLLVHDQDCCENVDIESLDGVDPGFAPQPIVLAEERSEDATGQEDKDGYRAESATWTFYTIRTTGMDIDIRWYGTSNGYYSESVSTFVVARVPAGLDLVGGAR